ncbi:MAG: DNA polymerase III subunit gamma/tau [Muribaculaceae bacterium]|nr:DNA polymerase III subunit gamma/tau [Muribaculaceae bacterium]
MSENYIVSARKYRPSTFSTVVGQQALTHTLKTAIASHRLAHAYLFCGPRGVGKTTCARIFAKAINCEHLTPEGEPCNECESCRAFNEQRSYNIVELDAASNNSVDDIRGITDQVRIPPQVGRYRVFIIDEVHMLSTAAFNAFLKTLEEPPEYAIFILATTEKQKIIPTILSRCQIYDFNRIRVPDIVKQLQYICKDRGVEAETAALNVIAEKADGAMRDALSIFDQVSASSEGHITYQSTIDNLNVLDYDYYFRLDEAFLKADVPAALLIYKEIRDKGFDSQFFVNGLAQHMRNLMVASNQLTVKLLEMNDDVAGRFVEMAARFSPGFFYRAMDLCNYCDLNYRDASNKIFIVELTLIKICQLLGTPLPPTGGSPTRLKKTPAAPATPPAAQAPAPSPAPPAQASAHLAASSSPAAPAAAPQRAATSVSGPAAGPAAHHPRAVIKAPHIYINNTAAAAAERTSQQGPAPAGTQGASRREPFTAQQVAAAWQDYIAAHPHDRLVINIMKTVTPKQIDAENYEITVNDAQYDFINNTMSKILAHVRDAVKNDMLAIAVKLGKSGQAPKIWTDREIVDDLRKHHPEMDEVIKDWGLGLA